MLPSSLLRCTGQSLHQDSGGPLRHPHPAPGGLLPAESLGTGKVLAANPVGGCSLQGPLLCQPCSRAWHPTSQYSDGPLSPHNPSTPGP